MRQVKTAIEMFALFYFIAVPFALIAGGLLMAGMEICHTGSGVQYTHWLFVVYFPWSVFVLGAKKAKWETI